jgi:glutamate synthase (NADPH) large chain
MDLMQPTKQGLYDPRFEHDACGVSFVADLHGRRSHHMVQLGLTSLCNLDHRGATNAEPNVGDGAGILVQVPDRFLREVVDFELPEAGAYAVGMAFLPRDPEQESAAMAGVEKIAATEGLAVLGWREVPVDDSMIGQQAAEAEPSFRMVFLTAAEGQEPLAGVALDRRCFVVRKRVEHELETGGEAVYFPSLSARTLVYKGSSSTCRTSGSSRRWPSCTAASPPTPSRRGPSPTPTGSWPTTARSTR